LRNTNERERGVPEHSPVGSKAEAANSQNNFTTKAANKKTQDWYPVVVWIPKNMFQSLNYTCERLTGKTVPQQIDAYAKDLIGKLLEHVTHEDKSYRRKFITRGVWKGLSRKTRKKLRQHYQDFLKAVER